MLIFGLDFFKILYLLYACSLNTNNNTNANTFFKTDDESFKILVLPFQQICTQDGKSYDAGFVVSERLNQIINDEQLKIKVHYWKDYDFKNFNDETAKAIRSEQNSDMLLFGAYQTDACSGGTEQVCLNYITDSKWKLDTIGTNLSRNYKNGGLNELKAGKIQEKVENLAIFISIIVQVKGIDHEWQVSRLQYELNNSEVSPTLKADIFESIGDELYSQGKYNDALKQYEKSLQLSEKLIDSFPDNQDFNIQYITAISNIGQAQVELNNFDTALFFLNKAMDLSKKLYDEFPTNFEAVFCLRNSYSNLGYMYKHFDNPNLALHFYQKCLDFSYGVFNGAYLKFGLSFTHLAIGRLYHNINTEEAQKHYKKAESILLELIKNEPEHPQAKETLNSVQKQMKKRHSSYYLELLIYSLVWFTFYFLMLILYFKFLNEKIIAKRVLSIRVLITLLFAPLIYRLISRNFDELTLFILLILLLLMGAIICFKVFHQKNKGINRITYIILTLSSFFILDYIIRNRINFGIQIDTFSMDIIIQPFFYYFFALSSLLVSYSYMSKVVNETQSSILKQVCTVAKLLFIIMIFLTIGALMGSSHWLLLEFTKA